MAKPKTKGKGKKDAKKQKPIKVDFFKEYGTTNTQPFRLNDQEFRFTALRRDLGNVNIDRLVETVEWRDEGSEDNLNAIPVLRGTLTLRKPHPDQEWAQIELGDGHVVRCELKHAGKWRELWKMRIQKPTLAYVEGGWSFDLADDLLLAQRTSSSFKFKAGKKKRRKGWYYHEIVKSVCRKYRIPLGKVTPGKHRITNFEHSKVSPLEAIRLAVAEEVKASGKRLVIAWRWDARRRKSQLTVLPMRRNKVLYQFKDHIRSADLTHQARADRATVLIVRGTRKKTKTRKRKKLRIPVPDKKAIARYGYIEQEWSVKGTVNSEAELRRRAKRELAERLELKPVLENLTHPGIAFVRRGDAVRVTIPEEGFKSKKSFLFVVGVTHTLSAGDYTMALTLGLTDPMDPNKIRAEREKATRAAKRKKKSKKKS